MPTESEIEELVSANMPLAFHMANKMTDKGGSCDFESLLSDACLGLWHAAQNYDPSKGVPFGTYAAMRMKWKMSRTFLDTTRAKRGFGVSHVPIDSEDCLGRPLHEILSSDTGDHSERFTDDVSKKQAVELVKSLSSREKQVITYLYGLNGSSPKTLADVGEIVGLTRERVRQIEIAALTKMRKEASAEALLKTIGKWKE